MANSESETEKLLVESESEHIHEQFPLFVYDVDESQSLKSDSKSDLDDAFGAKIPFGKYIVYVDESGDHSLHSIDEKYPVFVLALCVFHKRHYSEKVVSALQKFKFNHFGHDQIILHENDIRKEKGAFNIFRSKEQKLAFLGQLTDIIEKSNFVLIT